MRKISFLILLLISCTVADVENLYSESDDEYGPLKVAAATECIANNPIFANLKLGSSRTFNSYSILTSASGFIKIKDGFFIKINDLSASSVKFTVIGSNNNTYSSFINDGTYTVSAADNDAIVDMIAKGVCNGDYFKGTPKNSTSKLDFYVENYNILDSTDPYSTTIPKEHRMRKDTFSMSTSIPAFLFLWSGTYKAYKRSSSDSSNQTDTFVDLELSLTSSDEAACIAAHSDSDCNTELTANSLTIDSAFYSKTRTQNSDTVLQKYYYTNF